MMFASVLKFCPNHVLLLSAFAFHPMLNLSGFLEPSSADGMNFPTQQLRQTSSAEGDGTGGRVGTGEWGSGGTVSNF